MSVGARQRLASPTRVTHAAAASTVATRGGSGGGGRSIISTGRPSARARGDLAIGCAPAGVLRHHQIDGFAAQERGFRRFVERPSRHPDIGAGKRRLVQRFENADDEASVPTRGE